jgi:hypothetical protein
MLQCCNNQTQYNNIGSRCTGDWVGCKASLGVLKKRKICLLLLFTPWFLGCTARSLVTVYNVPSMHQISNYTWGTGNSVISTYEYCGVVSQHVPFRCPAPDLRQTTSLWHPVPVVLTVPELSGEFDEELTANLLNGSQFLPAIDIYTKYPFCFWAAFLNLTSIQRFTIIDTATLCFLVWDEWLSEWWLWGICFFGMWRRVVWRKYIRILKEPTDCFFRLEEFLL